MDNLTHSLTGVLLARAGLNRLAPRATALAIGAASLPDLDIVSGVRGSLCYLAQHRGFSHALFWAPLVALAPLPVWWWFTRKQAPGPRQWAGAYVVSLVAVISHLMLDWLNVYGIRLKLPFSGEWLRLDLVNIVDVWLWAGLLLCVLGPLLGRLVDSEMGGKRSPAGGRGMAWLGLAAVVGYVGLRFQLHDQALRVMDARLYQGETARRLTALPTAANPWQWTGLVETDGAWRVVPVNLQHEFDPDAARVFFKPDISRVRSAVVATETGRVFLDFAQCPLWSVTPGASPDGGVSVKIHDLRFGLPEENVFAVEFVLDAAGRVVREGFAFGTMGRGKP
jgi:inner membrane protein